MKKMSKMMQAVCDKIFVKILKKTMSKGGIILPDTVTQSEPQNYGLVLSVGEKVEGVKEGDIVMFHPRGGQAVVIDNAVYAVVVYNELYGILQNEDVVKQLGEEKLEK
jgi:chaperonin GroES